MKRLPRLLALFSCFLLASCLLQTVDPVVGADDAQEIPGLAGHWKQVGGNNDVFLRVNPDGSYSMGFTAADLNIPWRVMSLDDAGYIVEMRTDNDDEGVLGLFSLDGDHMYIQFDWTLTLIEQVAAETGLLIRENEKLSSTILPGQSKDLVLAALKKLGSAQPQTDRTLFIRQGEFIDSSLVSLNPY